MNIRPLGAERDHVAKLSEAVVLEPILVKAAAGMLALCAQSLTIGPATTDFEAEFQRVLTDIGA